MATRPNNIRKSQFIATTSFMSGDYLDLVRSGQNLKISYADFLTAIGATGSLQQQGELTGIPVLDIDGSTNNIRNIIGGSGITVSTSPLDGIKLDHNFTANKDAVPILFNEASVSPTIRSIQAGTGITVGGSGGVIQIATSGTPGSTKTIQVFAISDFPAPVAGVITLADDTEYLILNDVSSSNRFISGAGTVITGSDSDLITLEYTGTGTMFTSADNTLKLRDIRAQATSGTAFAVTSSTGLHSFTLARVNVVCTNLGAIDGVRSITIQSSNLTASNSGFVLANNIGLLLLDTCSFFMASAGAATAIDLASAVFSLLTIDKCYFNMAVVGYGISGLVSSGNIAAGSLGTVIACTGTGTFLNNVSPYDDRWEFALNSNTINSINLALATHAATTITIAASLTPVIIGATWVAQDMHRFTHTAGGRWTYTGKGTNVTLNASISGAAVAVSDTYAFYVYLNGVQVPNSVVSRVFSTSIGNISLIWALELATNDYVEIWIENTTGTRDFVIDQIVLRISS